MRKFRLPTLLQSCTSWNPRKSGMWWMTQRRSVSVKWRKHSSQSRGWIQSTSVLPAHHKSYLWHSALRLLKWISRVSTFELWMATNLPKSCYEHAPFRPWLVAVPYRLFLLGSVLVFWKLATTARLVLLLDLGFSIPVSIFLLLPPTHQYRMCTLLQLQRKLLMLS